MEEVSANPPPAKPGPDADLTGRRVGEFQVLRRLGAGGMGQVYLAEQVPLKRLVALKVLRPDLIADQNALERFRREAEVVARIHHANIVQVYAIGDHNGVPYIALEYVEGRNLRDHVARKGPPEAPLALNVMRQVASALQRAGEQGIVHRDIKPENILLTRKAEAKVTDFGLVFPMDAERLRLTQSGITMGTPLYMSPEQVQGQPTDPRSDIYSFGATCYHMLAGHPPFQGNNPYDVALKHVTTEPEPLQAVRPDLPPELCAIVHKMMAKDPAQRYQTGRDLSKDVQRLREAVAVGQASPALSLNSVPQPRAASNTRDTLPIPPPPRRVLWPWVLLSVVAAAAGGAGLAWGLRVAETPPTPAAPLPGDLSAVEPPETLERRERRLRANAEQFLSPVNPGQITLGLGHSVELALFFLEQWRLDEAEQVFATLEKFGGQTPAYGKLGRLGQAIVLGLKNRAADSNAKFSAVMKEPRGVDRFDIWEFINQNPPLRQWVALAVDYNLANSGKQPFSDDQLAVLRLERPPRVGFPPRSPPP